MTDVNVHTDVVKRFEDLRTTPPAQPPTTAEQTGAAEATEASLNERIARYKAGE